MDALSYLDAAPASLAVRAKSRAISAKALHRRIRVTTDTMDPRYCKGDTAVVELDAPAFEGDDAFIEIHDGPAFLLQIVAFRDGVIVASQFNPPAKVEFALTDIARLSRVVACFDPD